MAKVVATSLNRKFGYCTLIVAMFTKIVQKLELVRSVRPSILAIKISDLFRDRIELGGRIASNGVCLSARKLLPQCLRRRSIEKNDFTNHYWAHFVQDSMSILNSTF